MWCSEDSRGWGRVRFSVVSKISMPIGPSQAVRTNRLWDGAPVMKSKGYHADGTGNEMAIKVS